MTKELRIRSLDIPTIQRFAVGFDNIFDEFMRISSKENLNYPPYNVYKDGKTSITIELAVAGFSESDLDVQIENNVLTIRGEKKDDENESTREVLHRGISSRSFKREFTLAEHIEVVGAHVNNGILSVNLEQIIPENKLPRKIEITQV